MGKKTKTSFKKNDKRINRRGAPRLNPIIKQIRELEKTELTVEFSRMLRMILPELDELIHNPKTIIKELGIAKAIHEWIKTGSFAYVQPYIEYIFGKPTAKFEHSGKDGGPIETTSPREKLTSKVAGIASILAAEKNNRESK